MKLIVPAFLALVLLQGCSAALVAPGPGLLIDAARNAGQDEENEREEEQAKTR